MSKNRNFKIVRIALAYICIFGLTSVEAASVSITEIGTKGQPVRASSTNDIVATYQGNSAWYSNDLYLETSNGDSIFLFNNHSSPVRSTINLGSFSIGTELIFRLHVNNTGNDFFTGLAERNSDGNFHALVQENWQQNETLVSFEDLLNGPFDFNDLSFSFTNVDTSTLPPSAVPIPASIWLFGSSLFWIFSIFRKKYMN